MSNSYKFGAYVLQILLISELSFDNGQFRGASLAPGWYFYAGNAFGPGGIEARLRHHLSKTKRPHWHVDRLTLAARRIETYAFPGDDECRLIKRLLRLPGTGVPLSGFGSTDCKICPAHLLKAGDGFIFSSEDRRGG